MLQNTANANAAKNLSNKPNWEPCFDGSGAVILSRSMCHNTAKHECAFSFTVCNDIIYQ